MRLLIQLFGGLFDWLGARREPGFASSARPEGKPALTRVLARFENWLNRHRPWVLHTLQPGASRQTLARAEEALGPLPSELVDLWSWRNGQTERPWLLVGPEIAKSQAGDASFSLDQQQRLQRLVDTDGIPGLWEGWRLLSVAETRRIHGLVTRVVPPEKQKRNWWNPDWIPFLTNDEGGLICIDRSGSFGGTAGQVISVDFRSTRREIRSETLGSWLSFHLDSYEHPGVWLVPKAEVVGDHDGFRPQILLERFLAARSKAHLGKTGKHEASQPGWTLIPAVFGVVLTVIGLVNGFQAGFTIMTTGLFMIGIATLCATACYGYYGAYFLYRRLAEKNVFRRPQTADKWDTVRDRPATA